MIFAQFPQNKKLPVGRPELPLFDEDDKEVEEEFFRKAGKLIELYYKKDSPNPKLNYMFNPNYGLSKTVVWACIYLYYVYVLGMNLNDQGFVKKLRERFGVDVISDRTTIGSKHKFLTNIRVHGDSEICEIERRNDPKKKKYHNIYCLIVNLWKSL